MHASESEDVVCASEKNSEWKTVAGSQNPAAVEQKPTVLPKMPTKMDINKAHDVLGHNGEALLRKTCNRLDVTLTGALKPCEGCGFAKAKAKAASKTASAQATKPGERLFLDTSGPFSLTLNGHKCWIQMVDNFTRCGFCEFNKNKKGMDAFIRKLIEKVRAMGMETKCLRCDDAGEHMKDMLALCDEHAMVLELTAPDTPQMNGVVERQFVILKQRALAMIASADLIKPVREKLWCEAVDCANDLENHSASAVRGLFPGEMMTGKLSKLFPMLQPFGRIAHVTVRKKFKATWKEKLVKHVMVGCAKSHAADACRMHKNPTTKATSETRDVALWAEWKKVLDQKSNVSVFNQEPDLLNEPMGLDAVEVTEPLVVPGVDLHLIPDGGAAVIPDVEAGRTAAGRMAAAEENAARGTSENSAGEAASCKAKKLEREMKKLSWDSGKGRPAMNKAAVIEFDKDGNKTGEKEIHFVYNSELMTEHGEPKTFWDAIARDGEEGEHWLQASGSECVNFIERGSWRKKLCSEVKNEGHKIVGAKWVHKRKDEQDGSVRCKGRIVNLGHMQIPGVDHTESYSPVGNDTSVRIVIGPSLFNNDWALEIIDVEAAFLEGDMKKTMCIEWPDGMVHFGFITEEEENRCIEQFKSTCGNSDAALICFRLFKKHLIEVMEMKQSLADPCVCFQVNRRQSGACCSVPCR
jgi:hypothetical protein